MATKKVLERALEMVLGAANSLCPRYQDLDFKCLKEGCAACLKEYFINKAKAEVENE